MKNIYLITGFIASLLAISNARAQVEVELTPLAQVVISSMSKATAEVLAVNHTQLASEVTAIVEAIHADVGQRVAQGDELLQLDPADYQLALEDANAALAAATARLRQARQRLDDAIALSDKQFVSADDLLARRTELEVQQADQKRLQVAVAIARRQLEKTTLRAPFSGFITARSAQRGQLVLPGSPLATLSGDEPLEVAAALAPADYAGLQAAQSMYFRAQSGRYPVRLARVAAVIDATSRTLAARFEFTALAALAGEAGIVEWPIAEGLLPPGLVVSRQGQLGVFIAVDNQARFEVLPDAQEGRPARHELDPAALVVTRGHTSLNEGDLLAPSR